MAAAIISGVTLDLPEGWRLAHAHLPGAQVGDTCWPAQLVTIDPRTPPAVQRCTLAHEIVHIERGPSPGRPFDAAEELAVEKATARRLIDVRDLGEALAESEPGAICHVAELLHVDPDTLAVRLAHLHPAERAYLLRRLDHREPVVHEPDD